MLYQMKNHLHFYHKKYLIYNKMAGKYHKNLNRELNKLGKELVSEIKSDITRKGSVKTGKMRSSVDYKVSDLSNGGSVQIEAIDYYKYVDEGTSRIRARNFTKDSIAKVLKNNKDNLKRAAMKDIEELIKQTIYKK